MWHLFKTRAVNVDLKNVPIRRMQIIRGDRTMKLVAKILDIATRGVLLNRLDARSMGVLNGDRVQVINPKNGVSVTAFVETTSTITQQGTLGIYRITNERLHLEDGAEIEVREAGRPASLDFIKKKMDGGKLTKEETLTHHQGCRQR